MTTTNARPTTLPADVATLWDKLKENADENGVVIVTDPKVIEDLTNLHVLGGANVTEEPTGGKRVQLLYEPEVATASSEPSSVAAAAKPTTFAVEPGSSPEPTPEAEPEQVNQ